MQAKKVLVVPLNWGLGHTTRLVPIIRELSKFEAEVYFGGNQVQISLIKQEFPFVQCISFPTLKIRLGREKCQIFSFILQLPGFFIQVLREQIFLKKLIRSKGIDAVIADNVYGLWNKKVYTIVVSHQLSILFPRGLRWMQGAAGRFIKRHISKYNECWVPDVRGKINLAGRLSQQKKTLSNCKYIGILSRFDKYGSEMDSIPIRKNRLLILLSGPESQRTIFENLIAEQLVDLPEEISFQVIRGLPNSSEVPATGWKNHLPAFELYKSIVESSYIICRSGYSTIMDLVTLKKTALLVPTPGQTEQEYLADYLTERGWFKSIKQENFTISEALSILMNNEQRIEMSKFQNKPLLQESLIRMLEKA